MHKEEVLSNKIVRKNSQSYFRPYRPPSSLISAAVLLSCLTKVATTLTFPFDHHGNHYQLYTNAPEEGSPNDQTVVTTFHSVHHRIAAGECGNVTSTQQPPSQWKSALSFNICNRLLEIARNSSQGIHVSFEDCLKVLMQPETQIASSKCQERDQSTRVNSAVIGVSVTLAVFILVAGAFLLWTKYRQRGYDVVTEPKPTLNM